MRPIVAMAGLLLPLAASAGSPKTVDVVAERHIDAPAAEVWQAMVLDYGAISNFSPFIYASDYEADSLTGELGAERRCEFNAKGTQWTHERIASLDNDAMVMRNEVVATGRFPLNTELSYAIYSVRDNGDNTSTASYAFTYRTVPGVMTQLVRGKFQKTLEQTLIGLEHFVETGEAVNATTGNWKEIRRASRE